MIGPRLALPALVSRLLGFAVIVGCAANCQAQADYEVRTKIPYCEVNGKELLLDAYVPKKAGPHPAVLVVHGGAWRSGSRAQLGGYAIALAKMGFTCFAIDYRLAPEHKFPAQIDDCRMAIKFIRGNAEKYRADASRLGAIGYSAGGHLVSLLATTGQAPNEKNGNVDTRLQAVVAGGAPTDFRLLPNRGSFLSYWLGGDLDSAKENFNKASSAAFVDAKDTPTFFFNGKDDKVVPVIWSQSCYMAMKAAGVRTEMHVIDDAGHMGAAMDREALEKGYAFLKRELMGKTVESADAETESAESQQSEEG